MGLFRVALSEENTQLRERAIRNVRHDVVAGRLEQLFKDVETEETIDASFFRWVATTSVLRNEAAHEFAETNSRYQAKNEQRLNIAEEIGFVVFETIRVKKNSGVHTPGGIFEQVREKIQKVGGVHGAKDKDVLRMLWATYKGVVHLGMAITFLEQNPDQQTNVLHAAEFFRKILSENCPKGTRKPYVQTSEQINFIYISNIKGPRFRNRGLSYDVD